MRFLLGELGLISIVILSGGMIFREKLSQYPRSRIVIGVLTLVTSLSFFFECYGSVAKKVHQYRADAQREADVARENIEKAQEKSLNRELQAELKRLGCYRGVVDGDWGEQSK